MAGYSSNPKQMFREKEYPQDGSVVIGVPVKGVNKQRQSSVKAYSPLQARAKIEKMKKRQLEESYKNVDLREGEVI